MICGGNGPSSVVATGTGVENPFHAVVRLALRWDRFAPRLFSGSVGLESAVSGGDVESQTLLQVLGQAKRH